MPLQFSLANQSSVTYLSQPQTHAQSRSTIGQVCYIASLTLQYLQFCMQLTKANEAELQNFHAKNAYEINSYNCLWALCNSIDKCKLQYWIDHFFVFLLRLNTEGIKMGKVSYKPRKLHFLLLSSSLPHHNLCLSKHSLQWFPHTQLSYHLQLQHYLCSQIHPLKGF